LRGQKWECPTSNIPQHLIGTFFPSQSLSVSELLKFDLLNFPCPTSLWIITYTSNFPALDHSLTNKKLHAMQHPPHETIGRFLKTVIPSDMLSVALNGKNLPLPLVDIWCGLIWIEDVHKMWNKSIQWIQSPQIEHPDESALFHTLDLHLSELSWGGEIQGFTHLGPGIGSLTHYLSFNYLATLEMEQHAKILQDAMNVAGFGEYVNIVAPDYMEILFWAHCCER
jgi:hypothetical protein